MGGDAAVGAGMSGPGDQQGAVVVGQSIGQRAGHDRVAGPLDALSFIQAGAGAVSRTAQDKARETVSVWDFMSEAQRADAEARALREHALHLRTRRLAIAAAVLAAIGVGSWRALRAAERELAEFDDARDTAP
jgi:hypothetical protein